MMLRIFFEHYWIQATKSAHCERNVTRVIRLHIFKQRLVVSALFMTELRLILTLKIMQ